MAGFWTPGGDKQMQQQQQQQQENGYRGAYHYEKSSSQPESKTKENGSGSVARDRPNMENNMLEFNFGERPNSPNRHEYLKLPMSHQSSDATSYDTLPHFVDGNFAAGRVKQIKLDTGCWAMAFSKRADILATGLVDRVDLLECLHFNPLYSIPWSGKVSAIQWCEGVALDPNWSLQDICHAPTEKHAGSQIIAAAGLNGHVGVYELETSLVEFKGVQMIHEFSVPGEIRCMACKPLGKGQLLLAVGDKRGIVTMITIYRDDDIGRVVTTHPSIVDLEGDAILGLDIHIGEKSVLVVGSKDGKAIVYALTMTNKEVGATYVVCGRQVWGVQRMGSVRAVHISKDGKHVSFGGYDKCLVRVDLSLLAVVRELDLQGTVNTITVDPLDRYLVVGCRDKSVTFYDTSTFASIKRFQTPGWVSAISWGLPGNCSDIVAVRSENQVISLFDLTPIHVTNANLSSVEGGGSSLSWTPNGDKLARITGDTLEIVDARCGFTTYSKIQLPQSSLQSISFSPQYLSQSTSQESTGDNVLLATVGLDGTLRLFEFSESVGLKMVDLVEVEENLWVVAWSSDGKFLAVGGKGKTLFLFAVQKRLNLVKSTTISGRIWDIGFIRNNDTSKSQENNSDGCAIAVASGDYNTIFFDMSLQATLQVFRTRTVRCLDYHPTLPLLAVGDGAGMLAIVDYRQEETMEEFNIGARLNVVTFSPTGDFLLVGTDNGTFTLHETQTYKVVQEIQTSGFALTAAFSPTGKYLALGSSLESYSVVRLGPLIGIDLIPLDKSYGKIPSWALKEALFRSGFGPSLVQRHMLRGNQDSIQWVGNTLKEFPDAIYTLNRHRNENCLETAVRLRKAKLLQLTVKTLVDGSLEKRNQGKRSILTTDMPEMGRITLEAMLTSHPTVLIVDILQSLTFVKVPFTTPHVINHDRRMICASSTYLDPWWRQPLIDDASEDEGKMTRIPAVLPVPGLGSMSFLSALVARAPPTAFDNEAMGIVLQVMWQYHIRWYYVIDTVVFICYYALWILLIEFSATKPAGADELSTADTYIAGTILVINSLFAVKEIVQSNLGRRPGYFQSFWNQVDLISILLVYAYGISITVSEGHNNGKVQLAVVTTLLLTTKLISYLRAFNQTGWLVTVLSRNFWDVRGFLLVLLSILVGFSASFRVLFAHNEPSCSVEFESNTEELVNVCSENPFGSLRRAILATFELTILGSYEASMLHETEHDVLAILIFVMAVTCVLVVALNALISLLADSYARVQEDATANKRKEKAELIVEYLALLPSWKRERIEKGTRYFHALLEADADGDLVIDHEDWHGGLNALRDDLEENAKLHADTQLKAMETLKVEFERELADFRTELLAMLQDVAEDVRAMKKTQAEGGLTISGKRVAGAVKAVKDMRLRGTTLFKPVETDQDG